MNPFYNAHETSLSKLSDHDWNVLRHRAARGIDWTVEKIGRKWAVQSCFGNFPMYRTKREAGEVAGNLILAESRWRAHEQWERDHAAEIDQTPIGPQYVLPGAERISDSRLAQRRAVEKLKAKADQKPCDHGLFSDAAAQIDIEDLTRR